MLDAAERNCLRELVRRVAAYPRGLALLHRGSLEAVSVSLMLHPFIVSRARDLLDTPDGRAYLIEEIHRARLDQEREPRRGLPRQSPGPATPRTGAGLIRAARRHSLGASFLREGYPEAVAIMFHVHPDLVLRARDVLGRWERRKEPTPRRQSRPRRTDRDTGDKTP